MNTAPDPFGAPGSVTRIVGEAPKPTGPVGPPASPKQLGFLASLVQERDIETLNGNLYERAFDLATGSDKAITKNEASALISALLIAPKVGNVTTGSAEPPEGIHLAGDQIFKVQVAHHGSGKKYAKQLNKNSGSFDYVGRAPFGQLSEETLMTLAQAKEFGHLYGMCIKCGRTLTDEGSIAAGIGPICAESF